MRVRVIAYNNLGYRLDVAVLDEHQVRMRCAGIEDVNISSLSRNTLSGIGLIPKEFPEAVRFDIVIES